MIGFTAFKTSKPRQFEYRPLYYDPDKEEMEKRKQKVLGEAAQEDQESANYQPGKYIAEARMRRSIEEDRRNAEKRKSGVIRLAIFVVLVGICLWLIFR